ncbi:MULTISPECIES: NifU family protein [unclassified Geodermatophilus]
MDDQERVHAAARRVTALFRSHGGSVAVAGTDTAGAVEVRFGGTCSGCPSQALCLEHTVRPRLLAVPGVTSVTATGARVSDEADARLRTFLRGGAA